MKKAFLILFVTVFMFMLCLGCSLLDVLDTHDLVDIGDAHFNKGEYDAAIDYYKKAIKKDPKNAVAYNNIAAAYTFMDISLDAYDYCKKAIELDPQMEMAHSNMGLILNNLERYEEAIKHFDKSIELDYKSYFSYYNKGDALLNLERYQLSIESFNNAIIYNPKYKQAMVGKAIALYYIDELTAAEEMCDFAIDVDESYTDAYLWKARILIGQNLYDSAVQNADYAVSIAQDSSEAYHIKAIALMRSASYDKALESVEKAIVYKSNYLDAYLTKLSVLYKTKAYSTCIDTAEKALEIFPSDEDILWYIADSYSAQSRYKEAIPRYKQVLEVNPQNEAVWTYLGWSYYFLQDYEKAWQAANNANDINSESKMASELLASLEETKQPESERIISFIRNNYLYFDRVKEFEKKAAAFRAKESINYNDIAAFLNSIRIKDDYFTFILYGSYYDEFIHEEAEQQLTFEPYNEDTIYVSIGMFNSSLSQDFRKHVSSIKNHQEKNLIIDLRDNSGGYTEAGNEILDMLLPETTASSVKYRNGSKELYKSDKAYYEFKQIIILVNESTASSSELLALGLRKKLNNVKIVGQRTTGKGVGQQLYENIERKYVIFLVSFYWNIDDTNINGSGISPDIFIKGHNDKDYFSEVERLIKK